MIKNSVRTSKKKDIISREPRIEHAKQLAQIQNAYKEIGRQRRYIDYIDELLDMALRKKQQNMYSYIVEAFKVISQADSVMLRKFNGAKQNLLLEAMSGCCDEWWGTKYVNLQNTIFEKAWKEKKALKIPNLFDEPSHPWHSLAEKCKMKSLLIVPLIYKENLLGFISIYTKQNTPSEILDNEFIMTFSKVVTAVLTMSV